MEKSLISKLIYKGEPTETIINIMIFFSYQKHTNGNYIWEKQKTFKTIGEKLFFFLWQGESAWHWQPSQHILSGSEEGRTTEGAHRWPWHCLRSGTPRPTSTDRTPYRRGSAPSGTSLSVIVEKTKMVLYLNVYILLLKLGHLEQNSLKLLTQ